MKGATPAIGARAARMDALREYLLAGAGFAMQQYGGVAGGCQARQAHRLFQGGTLAYHVGEGEARPRARHAVDQLLHALDAAQDHYIAISRRWLCDHQAA